MLLIIIDLGWLILCRVICRTRIRRSCLQRPYNPITDYYQKKKERKKNFKTFLQAFTRNLSWIFLSCVIYRTSTDHAQID